ncbi:MAG: hypothetical protein HDR00_00755 [Lachnospiraceae bacterium]|nr:hypothetical protein [Lachnospiraceae bacterium]
MKKDIRKGLKEFGKKAAVGVATYYANISCPLVVYQPQMKDSVRKLRKF